MLRVLIEDIDGFVIRQMFKVTQVNGLVWIWGR